MHTLNWIKQDWMNIGLVVLLVVFLLTFLYVFFSKNPKWLLQKLGASDKFQALKFLGLSMGGVLLVISIVMTLEVNQKAEQELRLERLNNAIKHLRNHSATVRLDGAQELLVLAKDNQELRPRVLDILCTHIRETTDKSKYRREYKSKPSKEIQSLLSLLFVQDYKVFEGLNINLQESWLKGAKLEKARLQRANLSGAHLQGTNLPGAHLQRANLWGAHLQQEISPEVHLQGANLSKAHLQRANLGDADLREATFWEARLQEAILEGAQLQGASLGGARLQGANLYGARLNAAVLNEAHLQGADLRNAGLLGADLREAQLQGAYMMSTSLQGAYLQGANLQGVDSSPLEPAGSFAERMRNGINRESYFEWVDFQGGLTEEGVKNIVKDLLDEQTAKNLRNRLRRHFSPQPSNKLPENSGAITVAYTEEEAEQWIVEYEEAMSEVPKTANGQ